MAMAPKAIQRLKKKPLHRSGGSPAERRGLAVDEHKTKPRDGALFLDQPVPEEDPSQFAGDGKAEEAAEILEELVNLMDLDVQIAIRSDSDRIELDVTGPDSGRVIGKKGATLDALQFLINKMVNRFPEGRRHVIIDSGDYRQRHDDGLISMAKRQAQRAVNEGRIVTLQPMNARDRRVIHMSLAKFEGVSTMSQGEGSRRRIQIIPARRRR
jgi:spoIIIJ-associated protein